MKAGTANVNRMRRGLWLASAAVACLLTATPSAAQEHRDFNVPAQEAAQAVQTVARQSGLQVMAPEGDLEGVQTNPVRGRYGPIEAIERMLAGTGLEVVATGPGTVTIRRAATPARDATAVDDATSVGEIVVTGSRIARQDYTATSPIVTVDADVIEQSSAVSLEANLNKLPQFSPALTQFDTQDIQPNANSTPGVSTVSLRQLGANRNLSGQRGLH